MLILLHKQHPFVLYLLILSSKTGALLLEFVVAQVVCTNGLLGGALLTQHHFPDVLFHQFVDLAAPNHRRERLSDFLHRSNFKMIKAICFS